MRDTLTLPGLSASSFEAEGSTAAEDPGVIRWIRVWWISAFFFVVFFHIEHDPTQFAGLQVQDHAESRIRNEYVDNIESGNSTRQLVVISYGLGGLLALALCRGRRWNVQQGPAVLVALFLLWIVASVTWSIAPGLTFRRIIASGIMVVGSLGYARMLRPNELLAVALTTFTCFVGYSLLLDVGAGGRPWQSDYRFGGTLHPNIQAAYCGLLCLAAFSFPAGFASRWMTRGLLGFGLVMLYQTQSRTSALAVLVGMLMVFMVRLSPRIRYLSAAVLVSLAGLAMVVVTSQSEGGRKRLMETVLLGRTDSVGTLTGRVPLWEELSTYAQKRLLNGYGYESFWTPDHIIAVMKSQQWALQSAHNAYFEVVLQLGWIGLVLGGCMLLSGVNRLQSAYGKTAQAGYAFGYGVVAFALANSFLESHFAKLKYPTIIAVTAVLGVIIFYPTESRGEDDLYDSGADWRTGSPNPLRNKPARSPEGRGEERRRA